MAIVKTVAGSCEQKKEAQAATSSIFHGLRGGGVVETGAALHDDGQVGCAGPDQAIQLVSPANRDESAVRS